QSPSIARIGHGLCIKLLRCGSRGSSRLLIDQTDQRLRRLRAHAPHGRNRLAASAELLLRRQRVLVRNRAARGARLSGEIIERSRTEALEAIGRLTLERAQRLDVLLDGGADVFRVAAA